MFASSYSLKTSKGKWTLSYLKITLVTVNEV